MLALNAKYVTEWFVISPVIDPPPDWREWENVEDEYAEHVSPNPAKPGNA